MLGIINEELRHGHVPLIRFYNYNIVFLYPLKEKKKGESFTLHSNFFAISVIYLQFLSLG